MNTIATTGTQSPLPMLSGKVFSESPLDDGNRVGIPIHTGTITETNMLSYATLKVIPEMLGCKLNKSYKEQCRSRRRSLEAKIKAIGRVVIQLSELEKDKTKKDLPKKCIKLSATEALETAKLVSQLGLNT